MVDRVKLLLDLGRFILSKPVLAILKGVLDSLTTYAPNGKIDYYRTTGKVISHILGSMAICYICYFYFSHNKPSLALGVQEELRRKEIARSMSEMISECGAGAFSSWIRIEKISKHRAHGAFMMVLGCVDEECVQFIDYSLSKDCYAKDYLVDENTQEFLENLDSGSPVIFNKNDIQDHNLYAIGDILDCTDLKFGNNYIAAVKQNNDIIWIFGASFIDERKCDAGFRLQQISQKAEYYLSKK